MELEPLKSAAKVFIPSIMMAWFLSLTVLNMEPKKTEMKKVSLNQSERSIQNMNQKMLYLKLALKRPIRAIATR